MTKINFRCRGAKLRCSMCLITTCLLSWRSCTQLSFNMVKFEHTRLPRALEQERESKQLREKEREEEEEGVPAYEYRVQRSVLQRTLF